MPISIIRNLGKATTFSIDDTVNCPTCIVSCMLAWVPSSINGNRFTGDCEPGEWTIDIVVDENVGNGFGLYGGELWLYKNDDTTSIQRIAYWLGDETIYNNAGTLIGTTTATIVHEYCYPCPVHFYTGTLYGCGVDAQWTVTVEGTRTSGCL